MANWNEILKEIKGEEVGSPLDRQVLIKMKELLQLFFEGYLGEIWAKYLCKSSKFNVLLRC